MAMFGWGAWCAYDATVTYPHHNERLKAYQSLNKDTDAWKKYADEHGWSNSIPDSKPISEGQVLSQWYMLGGLSVAAVALLVLVAARYRWPLGFDDEGIIGPFGRRIPFDSIQRIDKRLWDKTGLALVHYDFDGKNGPLRIDDYVFGGADRVLEEVERRTGLGDTLGD